MTVSYPNICSMDLPTDELPPQRSMQSSSNSSTITSLPLQKSSHFLRRLQKLKENYFPVCNVLNKFAFRAYKFMKCSWLGSLKAYHAIVSITKKTFIKVLPFQQRKLTFDYIFSWHGSDGKIFAKTEAVYSIFFFQCYSP